MMGRKDSSLFGLTLLLTLFCYFINPTTLRTLYPLGINLGPTHITAAYFTINDQPVIVGSVKGTEAYQAYMMDTLHSEGKRVLRRGEWWVWEGDALSPAPPEYHDTAGIKDLFMEAFSSIKSVAEAAFGHEMSIGVISTPQHFNNTSISCVINAAMEIDSSLERPEQIRPFLNVASLAYGHNSCVDMDFGNWSDYDEEEIQIIILIDYSVDHMEILVAYVTPWGASRSGRKSLELSEHSKDHGVTSRNYELFKQALQETIAEHLPIMPSFNYMALLKAIIISGDESPTVISEIREIVSTAFPHLQEKFQDSVEPLYVGAVGAACWARQQVLHPALLPDIELGNIVPGEDEGHDEI